MYAYLRGRFTLKSPTSVWVDVQGIGFEVHISLHTYEAIQSLEEGTLYVYQLVKEDAHLLYGFADPSEKEVFLHLLSVSGVGASTARMMLSSLHPTELIRTIVSGNEAGLERIKGIGKKTAQRIVLELRDKMAKIATEISTVSVLKHNTLEQDALIAMTALGIAKNMAEQAIRKALQSDATHTQVESLIKAALKCL
ncbi:MAG: Holliday junction branch migration protein RuvA [Bacteroidetes bacterium]|nr:Holliday junction branch migration protein RuvA [Bacteroidota bacterium]